MDILLHNIQQGQLPLIQELANALGISFEKNESTPLHAVTGFESEAALDLEMNSRFEELANGQVKGYTWEELKAAARNGMADNAS